MSIKINVKGKVATLADEKTFVVCGNSDYEIEFIFEDAAAWAAYPAKTARFVWNGQYIDVAFTGNTCNMPIIQDTLYVAVGVYAGELHTTTPAMINAKKSILCDDPVHYTPPEDVYNQIIELIKTDLKVAVEIYDQQTEKCKFSLTELSRMYDNEAVMMYQKHIITVFSASSALFTAYFIDPVNHTVKKFNVNEDKSFSWYSDITLADEATVLEMIEENKYIPVYLEYKHDRGMYRYDTQEPISIQEINMLLGSGILVFCFISFFAKQSLKTIFTPVYIDDVDAVAFTTVHIESFSTITTIQIEEIIGKLGSQGDEWTYKTETLQAGLPFILDENQLCVEVEESE